MSVTNQSRTRRLYLNTNDAIKPPIVDGTSIVTDTQHEAYTARILNACDAKFNLATATLLKKPNERIGISLIKANFSADMALYANYSDDNPNIIFIFSEAPTVTTDGNQIGVNLTTEIFNDNNSNMSYPFTYKRGMLNFIEAVNTQIKNSRGEDSESILQVSAYSNILFQNSLVTPGLSVKVDNRCWNDPSFKGYHKSNKQIAADLGINTDTDDIYTELNNDSIKSFILINSIFGFPIFFPVSGKYQFSQFLYQAVANGPLVSSVGTAASGYGIYRRDAEFDGKAHTVLIFASVTGNPAPQAYAFNFMIADFIDNPNFDFTGWDPMTTNPFVEYSGAFAFGDSRTFPNSNLIAPTEGLNDIGISESLYGANRDEDQRFPIGINPSPLYIKTNKSLNSFTTMDSGMRTILAMCPIKAANKSVVYPVIQTTVIPDAPTILATPPEIEQKVNLDGSNDHINIPMDSNNPVLNWDQSWSIGFTAEEIHDAASGVGVKRTIATRGTNGIYLIIGTGNVGFYASATDGFYDPANNQGMTHAHGANTWYPTPANVKWLFTYNHTTGKLRWFVGEISNLPSYTQRGVITMTTTERTINQNAEDLNIGDAMDGHYGSTYFDGHLDDLIITNNELTGQQVVDYFTDDDFQSHEYSEHLVSQYNFNQTYPNVDDQVGSYNGTHQGSTNSDNFIAT